MSNILSSDGKHVYLLDVEIEINKSLPKYRAIEESHKGKSAKYYKTVLSDSDNDTDIPFTITNSGTPDSFDRSDASKTSYENLSKLFSDNGLDIDQFNVCVADEVNRYFSGTTFSYVDSFGSSNSVNTGGKATGNGLLKKLGNRISLLKKHKAESGFDAIGFFSDVKLNSEKEFETYRNRIGEFLTCIGFAEENGQTALKERLLRQLVVNKYESVLFAAGMTKAISEENLVKFVKAAAKTKDGKPAVKGLELTYMKNYVRVIPRDVMEKKKAADTLHVFDNYVVLSYSPDAPVWEETASEKKERVRKASDPILFGVIRGSKKLYFIADWVDEYCDLTFDEVVDRLGEEVKNDYIREKIS